VRQLADRASPSPAVVGGRDVGSVLAAVQVDADAGGDLDWRVSVDSTITRAPQHAARSVCSPSSHTGGSVE
jgi:hypothetical protein